MPPQISLAMYTFTDARGNIAHMGADEIQAIERSGSCSLRLYIRADRPEAPAKLSELSAAMRQRVSSTPVGFGPVEGHGRRFYTGDMDLKIHLKRGGGIWNNRATACGYSSASTTVLAFRKFRRRRTEFHICDECYREFIKERNDPEGRHGQRKLQEK